MKRFAVCLVAVCGLMLATAYAADEVKLDGVKCLVNAKADAKADKNRDYKDGKVYFCCDNCPKAFDKDTKKHAEKANYQLVRTGQAKQGKCPISGQDVNKEKELTIDGAKVQFCCDNCKGKVEKAESADKYKLVFSDEAWDKAKFKVEKKK